MPVNRRPTPLKHSLYWLFQVVLAGSFIGLGWLLKFWLKPGEAVSLQFVIICCVSVFVAALIHYLRHGPTLRGFWRKPARFANLTAHRR